MRSTTQEIDRTKGEILRAVQVYMELLDEAEMNIGDRMNYSIHPNMPRIKKHRLLSEYNMDTKNFWSEDAKNCIQRVITEHGDEAAFLALLKSALQNLRYQIKLEAEHYSDFPKFEGKNFSGKFLQEIFE